MVREVINTNIPFQGALKNPVLCSQMNYEIVLGERQLFTLNAFMCLFYHVNNPN